MSTPPQLSDQRPARRVVVIGWDAADWKVMRPMMERGLLPHFQRFIERGVSGRIATLDPPLSPTLWTSIATGKRPYKHGIHGFTEPMPDGKGVRPINVTSRTTKAVWNVLAQQGLKTHVVGWWPSHPAEPVPGVYVSNFYQRASGAPHDWPMQNGTVHPPELAKTLADLRIHPAELTEAHLLPFIPDAARIDQRRDKKLSSAARVLADAATIHSAATYAMQEHPWEFMAVYYDAIDHFSHGFMRYHPPRRPHIDPEEFDLYSGVVEAGYRFHDMMLGRLLDLAGEDTTVILLSDHGFYPNHLRPNAIPREPAGPAIEHSPYGIIAMAGPGIKTDGSALVGASVLDIAPTVLALYGLPAGEDMDGKVLTAAFDAPPTLATVPTWDAIDGPHGTGEHDDAFQPSAEEQAEELRQLVELGYIEDPGDDPEAAARKTQEENDFYLARAYLDGHRHDDAIRLLEALDAAHPNTYRYATYLASAYQQVGRTRDARRLIDALRESEGRDLPEFDIQEAEVLMAEGRTRRALALLQKVEAEAEPGASAQLPLRLAHAYLRLHRPDDAERAVRRALERDPEAEAAHFLLGRVLRRKQRYEEAAEALLQATELRFDYPVAHFELGEVLTHLEAYEDAVRAFDVCLRLAPGLNAARERIIALFEGPMAQPGRAVPYRTAWMDNLRGTITVVSGLPRSGTSLMMQMLGAADLPIFTDAERSADANNPKGYYEHEAVKKLKREKKWVANAEGQVVKVVAQLLPHLPPSHRYRVIFMERDLMEVLQSQQKMRHRLGRTRDVEAVSMDLYQQYEKTLEEAKVWAEGNPHVEVLYVPYREAVDEPFAHALRVADFLGVDLPVPAMAAVADRSLYRERKGTAAAS